MPAVVFLGRTYRALMAVQVVVPMAVHRLLVPRAAQAERAAHGASPHRPKTR
jgi:hypothetical protein